MSDLVKREPHWDLIHIDVQGAEVEICRSCIDELSARVRWIIAATHSRKLDGDLLELMYGAGWVLEHEKPAKFSFLPNAASLEAMTLIDGTQVWRNPRLLQAGDPLTSFSQEIGSPVHELRAQAGSTFSLEIDTKNTGTQPWLGRALAAPVSAGYRWLDSGGTVLPMEGNRAQLKSPVLGPGESDHLKLQVVAPPSPGSYTLWVSMVQEGVAWFFAKGAKPLALPVTVD
jgi:hypothetical protein